MTRIAFGAVSADSLGEMLAGYGVIAVVGELWPDASFWWNEPKRVVATIPGILRKPRSPPK